MEYYTLELNEEKIVVKPITEETAFQQKHFLRLVERKNQNGKIVDVEILFDGLGGFIITGNFTISKITFYKEDRVIYALVRDGKEDFLDEKYCLLPYGSNEARENLQTLINTIYNKTSGKKKWDEIEDTFFKEQIPVSVFIDYAGKAYIFPIKK